jgi:hypothetical protein
VLAKIGFQAHLNRVKQKESLASPEPAPERAWTRPDAYFAALARKRSFRRAHGERQRTQPEAPRMLLSTVPFLMLLGLLAVLGVAIMITAFPGSQPQPRPRPTAASKERGIAQRGWFQEAQKEMRH